MEDIIKVSALGGLDENGRDCYVIEINNDIFVLDAGLSLPDKTIPGVDFLLTNAHYIIENKNRDSIMKEFVKYNNRDLNKKASLVLSNNDINSIMKINSNYKYINSVLKEHIITLKKIKKKTRKKERIYLPLIVKYNKITIVDIIVGFI